MKDILDDAPYLKKLSESEKQRLHKLEWKVKKLKEKDWYGRVLMFVVAGFQALSLLINIIVRGFDIPLFLLNGILISLFLLLSEFSKKYKFASNLSAAALVLLIFGGNLIFGQIVTFWQIFFSLAILGAFVIFAIEANDLTKTEKEIQQLKERL